MDAREKVIPINEVVWRKELNERLRNAEDDKWIYEMIKKSNHNIPYEKMNYLIHESVEKAVKKRKLKNYVKTSLLGSCMVLCIVKIIVPYIISNQQS